MKRDFFAFLCPEAKSLNILQWSNFWKTQLLKAQRVFFQNLPHWDSRQLIDHGSYGCLMDKFHKVMALVLVNTEFEIKVPLPEPGPLQVLNRSCLPKNKEDTRFCLIHFLFFINNLKSHREEPQQ